MPSLQDLLAQSMLFSAARGKNLPAVPVATDEGAFRSPRPRPQTAKDLGGSLDETSVLHNPIWRFAWDPANPGTFERVQILSRGMGMDYGMPMTAFDKIEFREVRVVREGGRTIDLYLDPAHMLGAWWTRQGFIPDASSGLWQLEAEVDCSLLAVFGYSLNCDKAEPLTMEDVEALGDSLMPATELGPRALDFIAGETTSAWVCVGPVRYIVAVELVLCKERNDFVPGGAIGFARMHPHLLFWANEDTTRVEATIVLDRPAKVPAHHDAMGVHPKALVVTDTNVVHDPSGKIEMPIPSTDRLYDYFETDPAQTFRKREPIEGVDHPLQREGEVTLADARFERVRVLENVIQRRSPLVADHPDCVKEPRQGQFDSVHIAPRMNLVMYLPNGEEARHDELVMLNACLHDCTHMHVRWLSFLPDKIIRGWKRGRPFAEPGAPLVPENQTVFASFPSEHTLRYRVVSENDAAGKVVVAFHHGLAYAVDEWPTWGAQRDLFLMRKSFEFLANEFEEPHWNGTPNDEWALFYFRVRYAGKARLPQERSVFDLEKCMR